MSAQGWRRNFSSLNRSGNSVNHLGQHLCRNLGDEPTPPREFVREWAYLYFNSPVAGLRLRQEQVPIVGCKNLKLEGKAYDTACTEDTGFWIVPTFEDAVGMDSALVNKTGGETVYFLAGQSQVEIQQRLRTLEDKAWLSQRTKRVELLYTTYNAHLNLVTGMYIYFFVNRAGHIHKFVKTISVSLDGHTNIRINAADNIFLVLVCTMFIASCRKLYLECRLYGLKKGVRIFFSSTSNYIELLNVAWGVVLVSIGLVYNSKVEALNQFLSTASTSITGGWAGSSNQERYFTEIDEILEWMQWLRTMLAIFPPIIFVRILLVFHNQPRLALITQTFSKAGSGLLHFAIVLGSAILTFSAVAHIFFGHQVEGFETIGLAILRGFRALLGDIDYDGLVRVGRPMAICWFVGFTAIVQLIMLNMTLAIIMDAYTDVKNSIPEDAETIWSQCSEICRRWYQLHMGRRISLDKILRALRDVESESVISVPTLLKSVKGLPIDQARRILSVTLCHIDLQTTLGSNAEMADCIRRIEGRTKILVHHQSRQHHHTTALATVAASSASEQADFRI